MIPRTNHLKISLATIALWTLATTTAFACPTSRNNYTDYSRRDSNRCEGRVSSLPVSGSSLKLISLASRGMTSFSDNLLLQIPYSGSGQPFVRLLSTADRYQLDDLALVARDSSQTYNFFFPTDILDLAGVEPSELRAIAYTDGGLYSPVLIGGLGTGSGYDIVFYANHDTKIKKFEIRRNGSAVYSTSRSTFRKGSIVLSWNGRTSSGSTASAGTYQIYLEAEVQRPGVSRNETLSDMIDFIHNPDWIN